MARKLLLKAELSSTMRTFKGHFRLGEAQSTWNGMLLILDSAPKKA